MLYFRKLLASYLNIKLAFQHFHISHGNQRILLQKNRDVVENVSIYKASVFDLELE